MPDMSRRKSSASTESGHGVTAFEGRVNEVDVGTVVLDGDISIVPTFRSLYPEEILGGRQVETLQVCGRCFKYGVDPVNASAHMDTCRGTVQAWRAGESNCDLGDGLSIVEVDGEAHSLFAQNLSLFAKLFIKAKSVCFDVTGFVYYIMIYTPRDTVQHPYGKDLPRCCEWTCEKHKERVVGFFSKERLSWDNNTLACILMFPPWQKHGLGQVLMQKSYDLFKDEGKCGGPERPLSDDADRAFYRFWRVTIARQVLSAVKSEPLRIEDISSATAIRPEDVLGTLRRMGVVGQKRGAQGEAGLVVDKAKVRAFAIANGFPDVAKTRSKRRKKNVEWV